MCSANIRPRSSWLPDLLLCFLIVGLALGLYVRTLAPSVLISDLSEYQFVLYELGIPHPTGYPLYVLLGHLWSRLPIGSVAYRINLFSAVLGALALAMLYLALRQVIAYHGLVLGLTLFFAVAPTFWSQVLVAGTYPLNALLFALLLYLVLRYMQGRVSLEPVLLAYGFGLAHHRTMILLGPALLVLVTWQRHERWNAWRLFKLSTCLFAPLLLYVYIPMRAPQIGRNELTSFSGLLHYLSGQTFVGLLFQQGWTGLPGQIGQWLAWTVHEFTPLGMLLALGGLGIALYRYRALGTFTLLAYLGYLAFNLNYYIGNIWIYYIPCYMLILCWIAVFLEHMYGWVGRLFGTASSLRVGVQGALTIALIGTAVLQAVINYRTMDMSHEYTMENLWLDALALPLAEGGAVLANWDKHTSLVYYQRVEGKRPDLLPLIATDENTNRALAEGARYMRLTCLQPCSLLHSPV